MIKLNLFSSISASFMGPIFRMIRCFMGNYFDTQSCYFFLQFRPRQSIDEYVFDRICWRVGVRVDGLALIVYGLEWAWHSPQRT